MWRKTGLRFVEFYIAFSETILYYGKTLLKIREQNGLVAIIQKAHNEKKPNHKKITQLCAQAE